MRFELEIPKKKNLSILSVNMKICHSWVWGQAKQWHVYDLPFWHASMQAWSRAKSERFFYRLTRQSSRWYLLNPIHLVELNKWVDVQLILKHIRIWHAKVNLLNWVFIIIQTTLQPLNYSIFLLPLHQSKYIVPKRNLKKDTDIYKSSESLIARKFTTKFIIAFTNWSNGRTENAMNKISTV